MRAPRWTKGLWLVVGVALTVPDRVFAQTGAAALTASQCVGATGCGASTARAIPLAVAPRPHTVDIPSPRLMRPIFVSETPTLVPRMFFLGQSLADSRVKWDKSLCPVRAQGSDPCLGSVATTVRAGTVWDDLALPQLVDVRRRPRSADCFVVRWQDISDRKKVFESYAFVLYKDREVPREDPCGR
jgi:hypothetical protein